MNDKELQISTHTQALTKKRARNGHGHTYKHKNGYRTVVRYKGQTITAMGPTQTASKAKAKAKIAQVSQRNAGVAVGAQHVLVAQFLEGWLGSYHAEHLADTTYHRYMSLIRLHINPVIGHLKLQDIKRADINQVLHVMKNKGQSDRSRQQARAVLSKAFNEAILDDLIALNPVKLTQKITVDQANIQPLPASQVRTLLNSTSSVEVAARVRLAVLYGLRQGEALGLQWEHVDFITGRLVIRQQVQLKGGVRRICKLKTESSARTLKLDPITLKILREYKALEDQKNYPTNLGLLFPNPSGGFKDQKADRRVWKKALAHAGLPDIRLHDARHTAATLLYDKGKDVEAIRRFLGHSSVVLTSKTYVHHSTRQVDEISIEIQEIQNEI